MFKIFYEDVTVGDTASFGSYTVTKEEVINFASQYDPQPFHLNEEFAKQSVFGGLCASGWHTAAMMMAMTVKELMQQGMASMGSPGIDELRWVKPVMVGDVLRVEQEITEKRESESRPNMGLLKIKTQVINDKDVTVMTLTANMMIMRRPK